MVDQISEEGSFDFWSFWEWLKGRKRSIITALAGVLLYVITDEALASIIGGVVIEAAFAIGDYYFSKVVVKQK
jgi:hypothetical protein